jgi:hypothetical protein
LPGGREHVEPVDEPEHPEGADAEAEHHGPGPVEMVELTRRIAPDLVHVMMVALLGPARQSIGGDTGLQSR